MRSGKQLKLDVFQRTGEALESLPELPERWQWARLEDIAKIIMGQSPSSSTYNEEGEGLPFYQGKVDFGSMYPTPKKWCTKPQKIAFENDVLISVRAPVGPVNICKEHSCIGRGLAAVRAGEDIDYRYLFFFMMSKESTLAELGKGSTFEAIKRDDLRNLRIPLPSVEQQRRIVARIEEIASRVEQAKKLREEALQEAQAVMQSALHEVFAMAEEKGWKWVKLKDTVNSLKNGIYKPAKFYGRGYPCLRMYNIENRRIVWRNVKYLEVTREELEEYGLLPNDILINRVNSIELVGKTALVENRIGPCTFESKNIRIRVKEERILASFLVYFLDSQMAKDQLLKLVKPIIGQATINQQDIKSINVPLPSLDEQKGIVAHLDVLQKKTEALKAAQEATRKELDAVIPSVLDLAFRGKL